MTAPSPMKASVAERVSGLRQLALIDPQAAQDAAWAWFERVGAGLPAHSAEIELAELFAVGGPADVDGQTEGILVGWTDSYAGLDTTARVLVPPLRLLTTRLGVMPWLGKKFDKQAQRGTNTVTTSAVLMTAIAAPTYRLRRTDGRWEGFDMLNRVEASVVAPETQVLVLDYETIGTNPWPINRIRDEAVQIVPGTYLGAKLWHQADGYRLLAYWAARTQL
ncbi:hypothetical protein FOS14_04815 [Skermania sp. ID1734]|uniref:hypothetical protein n=1 Tax=Skermania sp. ID1734 TaxID=2597516 RepID=UPI00117CBD11|nr:hypothetical protein [Skermania sp. ID1734]TSE01076.1 hypothetical protein FOS14_04815 [Skermania sp. ID1734]